MSTVSPGVRVVGEVIVKLVTCGTVESADGLVTSKVAVEKSKLWVVGPDAPLGTFMTSPPAGK